MLVVSLLLVTGSNPIYAQRIVIAGKPILLKLDQGYHVFPSTYTDDNNRYLFISFLKTNRVCFLQKNSSLASLDMVRLTLEENGGEIFWYCYEYDPNFFEIDY